MTRHSLPLVAGLALLSCNAVFGIEEGVLITPPQGEAGSGALVEQVTNPNLGFGGNVSTGGAGGQGTVSAAPVAAGGGSAGLASQGEAASGPVRLAADAGASAPLPSGLVVVDETLVFTGRSFSHSLGLNGFLTTPTSAFGVTLEPDCGADPDCFAELAGGEVCVRGTVERVVDNDFVNAWGVNIQLSMLGDNWDRYGGRIKGLSFQLAGTAIPELRFHATRPPTPAERFDNYCRVLQPVSGERVDVFFDELKISCWSPEAMTLLPPTAPLSTLAWQIDANAQTAKPFDFCIRELRPILSSQ